MNGACSVVIDAEVSTKAYGLGVCTLRCGTVDLYHCDFGCSCASVKMIILHSAVNKEFYFCNAVLMI